jgi:putative addiction module component (TIGR02574 family)
MDTKSQSVLDAALELTEAQRAWLATEVLASLPPDDSDGLSEDDWIDELNRRWQETKDDPDASVAWSELREQI